MRGFTHYTRLGDALKIILSNVERLGSESVPFDRALGRVLAEDAISKVNVPPFDRSAVDGYAVRASDTFGASAQRSVKLRLIGSIMTGSPARLRIRKGGAVKIMTGAQMPKGADAVVMVEYTKARDKNIKVFTSLTPNKNVSGKGEDVRAGEVVLKRGQVLRPQDIGMLAGTGNLWVRLVRRPKVAILATGGELRKPGKHLPPAKITDANSYSLAAAVVGCGGEPKLLGIVPDKLNLVQDAIGRAAANDLVLISGGSSVGERDLVPDAITKLGKLLFHGVAIRPGGPTAFGTVRNKPVFALAGFPVATLVAFGMLVRPALWVMQGLSPDHGRSCVSAKLTRKISSTLGRADVVRVKLISKGERLLAEPLRITGSSILSSMTRADGFVVVPENIEGFEKGCEVGVELYR